MGAAAAFGPAPRLWRAQPGLCRRPPSSATHTDGRPRCGAAYLCSTLCPAQCTTIEAAETDDRAIEKYPSRFEIDSLRCVFCGYCVDACPEKAILMTREYEQAVFSREQAIWDLEFLMNRKRFRVADMGYRPRHDRSGRSGTRG